MCANKNAWWPESNMADAAILHLETRVLFFHFETQFTLNLVRMLYFEW